jgi:uncharacterized protein
MSGGQWLMLLLASVVAGGVNAVAGGGTFLTFPVLLSLGVSPVVANGTSTVGLWPGGVSGYLAYRPALRGAETWIRWLVIPGVIGGAVGALLVLLSGDVRFRQLVPWLILLGTLLFVAQPMVSARIRRVASHDDVTPPRAGTVMVTQGVVSIYGGYFGAGAGIMMLAAYALLGVRDLSRMNAFKNLAAVSHNLAAVLVFIGAGRVRWPLALAMMAGSMLGGWLAARWSQRLDPRWVRTGIIVIGFATSAALFLRTT